MREMVEYIVKQIVDNPEEGKVQEMKGESYKGRQRGE